MYVYFQPSCLFPPQRNRVDFKHISRTLHALNTLPITQSMSIKITQTHFALSAHCATQYLFAAAANAFYIYAISTGT